MAGCPCPVLLCQWGDPTGGASGSSALPGSPHPAPRTARALAGGWPHSDDRFAGTRRGEPFHMARSPLPTASRSLPGTTCAPRARRRQGSHVLGAQRPRDVVVVAGGLPLKAPVEPSCTFQEGQKPSELFDPRPSYEVGASPRESGRQASGLRCNVLLAGLTSGLAPWGKAGGKGAPFSTPEDLTLDTGGPALSLSMTLGCCRPHSGLGPSEPVMIPCEATRPSCRGASLCSGSTSMQPYHTAALPPSRGLVHRGAP